MDMYLFFDTETTGLPRNRNVSISDLNNWPRLVQIAWLLCDDSGNQVEGSDYIIKPKGFTIPNSATRIHGITTEKAMEEGVPLGLVLEEFSTLINRSDQLVAHNMEFDEKIVGAEFVRENISNHLFQTSRICTMRTSTDYCKIPGRYGYKWPNLSELHFALFRTEPEEAHNALADVEVCAKCFFELKELGMIKE